MHCGDRAQHRPAHRQHSNNTPPPRQLQLARTLPCRKAAALLVCLQQELHELAMLPREQHSQLLAAREPLNARGGVA